MIETNGKLQATIDLRKAKGNKIISEIMSILGEISFGKYKLQVAIKLREAMMINEII